MWSYFFYYVDLLQCPRTQYTGQQFYVRKLIEDKNMSFFPLDRALCLPAEVEVDDGIDTLVEKSSELERELGCVKGDLSELLTGKDLSKKLTDEVRASVEETHNSLNVVEATLVPDTGEFE